MKSLKVAKLNFDKIIKSVSIYYIVLITVMVLANYTSDNGNNSMSGLEITMIVFLFVCGLTSFKSNFYVAKSNGISRKSFIKGLIVSSLLLSFVVAIIDISINRVINIFKVTPTMYDGIWGNYGMIENWTQSNSVGTLCNTMLLQFSLYLMVYIVGIVISMIYYRCNKYMKIIVSLLPVALVLFCSSANIGEFGFNFSINLDNILFYLTSFYYVILICLTITIILIGAAFLLIRKAPIKER